MDGKTLAAFVGKLLPLAMTERVDGLFISVSPLTPDAGDYMSSLAAALQRANLTLTTWWAMKYRPSCVTEPGTSRRKFSGGGFRSDSASLQRTYGLSCLSETSSSAY
jgi:hypothetical protein